MPRRTLTRRLGVALLALASCGATAASGAAGAVSALPDLKPGSLILSTSELPPGGTFRLSDGVTNAGRRPAGAFDVRFYLSRDRSRSRDGVRLQGVRRVAPMRPSRSSRGRTRVRLPAGTRPGSYWVLACADPGRRVRESRERNNCRLAPRRLRVTARQVTPTPAPGGNPSDPPPPPATPASAVIAAAGDVACDPADPGYDAGAGLTDHCHQKQVSDLLAGSDKVLALGDLQYEDATVDKFNEVYNPSWGRFKSLTAPVIGNHEYGDPAGGAAGYFDYFNGVGNSTGPAGERSKAYYSFDVGAWHLVALNSNCGQVSCDAGGAQEQWLRGDLAANPSSCTLAFWHHPLFTSESGSATTSVRPLWKALRENAVDVLLVGHAHNYERFARLDETGAANPAAGLRQFVVGTGGKDLRAFDSSHAASEFRDASHFGVLRLSLHAGSYDWRFVTETGAATDSGSEACI